MLVIKYGCLLSDDNKSGTDLTVQAFSDVDGNTSPVAVLEGDYILEVYIDPYTLNTSGKIWLVHSGSAWEDQTPEGFVTPGTAMIGTAPDIPYQKGSMIVFLYNNEFVTVGVSQTQVICQSMINAALNP